MRLKIPFMVARAATELPVVTPPDDVAVPANNVVPVVDTASEPPRDTLETPPPCLTSTPPGEPTMAAELGDDDPTSVLSREAIRLAMAGKPLPPKAAPHNSGGTPAPLRSGSCAGYGNAGVGSGLSFT